MQTQLPEENDCGIRCLERVVELLESPPPSDERLAAWRAEAETHPVGITPTRLQEVAREIGLVTGPQSYWTIQEIASRRTPCWTIGEVDSRQPDEHWIAHVFDPTVLGDSAPETEFDGCHYVLLHAVNGEAVLISDPFPRSGLAPLRTVSLTAFEHQWAHPRARWRHRKRWALHLRRHRHLRR